MVDKPLMTSNITPAALFRAVAAWEPCLLIDEADTFINSSEALRGVINSGHTRNTAFVYRLEKGVPVKLNTYAPQVIAMIGEPPATITDRSIKILLQRKSPREKTEKLRRGDPQFPEIRRKCLRWAKDNFDELPDICTPPVNGLNDRASDNWHPLLSIAELVGGRWPERARRAAITLAAITDLDDDQLEVQMLADIKEIFERTGEDILRSTEISSKLAEKPDRPWSQWKGVRAISSYQMANSLRKFGIKSKTQRRGSENFKGYRRSYFEDAFSRYVI